MQLPNLFLCYPPASDYDGKISHLREGIERELRLLTGALEYTMFQSVEVGLGEHWIRRVRDALDQAGFLVPVVQPALFTSRTCRDELQAFLARERTLGRDDLVLPIYYIDCDDLRPDSDDELKVALAGRKYEDYRHLRPGELRDLTAAAAVTARRMLDAFRRVRRPDQPSPPATARAAQPTLAAPRPPNTQRTLVPEHRRELIQMLISMFSSGEFRRVLQSSSVTAETINMIPSDGAAAIQVFTDAVEALDRQGLIDDDLFARLIAERPRREREIRDMMRRLPPN